MSFGLSTIHFPKDKVIAACAFRLAGETVNGWLTAEHPLGQDRLHQYVSDRLSEMKLLPGDVNLWLRQTQDGTTLDSVIDAWREGLNDELSRARPPANALASTISQHDQAMQQQNLRDSEPNGDILTKSRDNVGLYLRQVQQNLLAGLRQRAPQDLESWVERMVDDPQRRQSEARAALTHVRELFIQAAAGLDSAVQQNIAPLEPMREQAKNAALQKLHNDAGSMVLKVIPGAYVEAINQDRDQALFACAAFYKCRLDTVVARCAARFFHEMPAVIDHLIADLDAYMVKLEGIRNEFKSKEQETISSPVFVNGERLWDRDVDIDTFYAQYATAERKGNVSSGAVRGLVEEGKLYQLRKLDDLSLRRQIMQHAQHVFAPLQDDVDVLSRFFQKYPDTAKRLEAIRQVYRLSQPFIDLKPAFFQSADDFVALAGKRQTVVGVHNGSQPGTPQESEFRNLLNQVERLAPEKFALLNNSYEVLFLQESAAYPLRLLREVDSYRQDYDFMATQGATQNPLHVRKDVQRWEPIYVPGSYAQDAAWETFAVGWGSGVIQDSVDRAGRVTYTTSFRDEFGMPVDRTVGQLLKIDKGLEKEPDRPADSEAAASPLPPIEVRDIILTLCQDRTLMEGVRRGIESRIVHLGSEQFASALAAHADEQKKRDLSFYEAYRQRLTRFMTQRNIRPPRTSEGQPARLAIAPADAMVRPDGSLLLTANVFDGIGRELTGVPVSWSARPTDVGMVDANGQFHALRPGEAVITASAGSVTAMGRVRVDPNAAEIVAITETPEAAAVPLPAAGVEAAPALPDHANGGAAPLPRCICGAAIVPGVVVCPACGKPLVCRNQHPVKPTWKKCPFCGDDLSPRTDPDAGPGVCAACHTPLEPGFQVCPECGAAVGSAGPAGPS